MIETDKPSIHISTHLRPINVRRDLLPIADFIELCFASTMDPDGREYLRQMRQTARDAALLTWAPRMAEIPGSPVNGFVWDEDNKIVGNLSLIPFRKQGQRTYLIANVAVHPDYRRRGIGRALTQAALGHARVAGSASVWLQVREENEGAYNLYHQLGFIERTRRTTWMSQTPAEFPEHDPAITLTPRRSGDWPFQKAWLDEIYPPEVVWNLPLDISRLKPNLINSFYRFMLNEGVHQWSAHLSNELIGVLAWEPSRSYADSLWLAAPIQNEEQAILALLPYARRSLRTRRPMALNYPSGRAVRAFEACNFFPHQTLIWMEVKFKETGSST